jgi:hypothetical protein
MPAKSLLSKMLEPCLTSLFISAIPATQRGAALGGLDVVMSAVGVVAPLLGGWVFGATGTQGTCLVSGAFYGFLALFCAALVASKG